MDKEKTLAVVSGPSKTSANQQGIVKWLVILSEHFGNEISKTNGDIYKRALADLSESEVDQACLAALQNCKFMPTVADIRQHVKRVQQVSQSTECDRDWALLLDRVVLWDEGYGTWGMSGPPGLTSAAWYALKVCGGPAAIQRTKPEHLPILKKTWDEAYSRTIEHEQLGLSDGQSKKLLAQVGEAAKVKSIQ